MSFQGFLDHLLKSATTSTGSASGGIPMGNGPGSLLNADFGKGALAGGALGLLLGKHKKTRKLATYGGLAALGVMAYKAYGEYTRKQGDSSTPQTVDRLPPPQAETHSAAILTALVAAAKADGHIDDRERAVIEGECSRLPIGADVQQWLQRELAKPLDPVEVAASATTPEIASEMYLASLIAIDEQNFMERTYLDEFARQLKLDPALKASLEQTWQQQG